MKFKNILFCCLRKGRAVNAYQQRASPLAFSQQDTGMPPPQIHVLVPTEHCKHSSEKKKRKWLQKVSHVVTCGNIQSSLHKQLGFIHASCGFYSIL